MTIQVPSYLRKKTYPARWDRWLLGDIFQPGVKTPTDLAVTTTGAAGGVSVARGVSYILGSQNPPDQGTYRLFNDAAYGLVHDAAVANPRWDRVITRVYDSDESGAGSDQGTIEIVKGAENASAAITNALGSEQGIGSLAGIYNYYELARVLVPVGGTAIPAINIRDVRLITGGQGLANVLQNQPILDVGVVNQIRAARELVVADFTTLLGLGTPVGLWDAGSLTNLGSGGNLINKGAVPLTAKGINGTANHAALLAGSTGQALYIADTGAADPFRIKMGSWGCWFRTAKRGTEQSLLGKDKAGAGNRGWFLEITTGNVVSVGYSLDGTAVGFSSGVTDVCDDRLHFAVTTFDGSVFRVYVDGVLEVIGLAAGAISGTSGPFNVGGIQADNTTAAILPFFGRIAVPFVTPDVVNEDQVRLLMAAKIAHGYATTPTRSSVAIRRKRKGGPYVVGDFTATPKVLYNFTAGALTDAGSLGSNLTNNAAAISVAGANGQASGAFQFAAASSQYLSATDIGLPAGTTARTLCGWFKTTSSATISIMGYGTVGFSALVGIYLIAGNVSAGDTSGVIVTSPGTYNDGQWHFAVFTYDGSASDGVKGKLYIDGRCVAGSTATLASTTPAGAGGLRVGNDPGGSYFTGAIDGVAITDYAMAEDEILSLFAKGSVALPASEKNQGDNVEAMDATNVYVLFDDLDSQHSVDLRVAA